MGTSAFERLWQKLAQSKKYRERFVSAFVKRSIPLQTRALMKQHGLTQEKLAKQAGITQGVVSRAIDLNYGNLTLNTVVRIAAGLDCAFVGRYVPFSELGKMITRMPDTEIAEVPSFEEENSHYDQIITAIRFAQKQAIKEKEIPQRAEHKDTVDNNAASQPPIKKRAKSADKTWFDQQLGGMR